MNIKIKKTISLILMTSIILGNFIYPTPAYAKISFNRFTRSLGRITRHIGRGSKFVINLPDKATRWMGPVVGPIASTILTRNIAKNPRWGDIFKNLGRASRAYQTLYDKDKYLAELRNAYHSQANELRNQANRIRESRTQLQDKLTSGDMTYADYRDNVLALEDIAQVYETAADKFDKNADKMRSEDIVRIFTRDAVNQVWNQVKGSIISETDKEIDKYIDPTVIKNIISGQRVDFDTFLEGLAASQIRRYQGAEGGDFDVDALRDRVKDRIKEILEENKEEFKNNWREKVDEIIKNMIKELEDEKKNLPEVKNEEEEKPEEESGTETTTIDTSDDKCPSGYEWNIKVGKCVQSNCYPNQIPTAHHSYVLDCVCGTSGSINEKPEDPNKACRYPGDHKSCPNCVYACVGLKEDCPEAPKD